MALALSGKCGHEYSTCHSQITTSVVRGLRAHRRQPASRRARRLVSSIIDHRSLVVCAAATVSSGVCPRGAHTPPAAAGVWRRDPGGSSSLRPCVRGAREGVVEPAEPVSHLHLRRHPLRRPAARRHLVSARRNTLLALSSATLVRGAACFTYFTYFTSSSPPQRGRARVAAHRRSPHGLPASTMSTSGSRRPLAASLRSSTSSASGVCM